MNILSSSLLVFIGAGCGGIGRFALGLALSPSATRWPTSTLAANLAGCLFAGLLAPLLVGPEPHKEGLRLLLGVGLLGGFTTFSAFGKETVDLVAQGHPKTAAAYAATSVILGLTLTAVGWWISHTLRRA